jgi:hypothetical protein
MLHSPQRLPLLINIGFMAARASTESHLENKFPFTVKDNNSLSDDLWDSVRASLIDLADMDYQSGFYPPASPLLSEFGLLEEYWKLRHYLDLEIPDHPWC